jgi:pimeloyl-ACP methyl ester carboxylesterase
VPFGEFMKKVLLTILAIIASLIILLAIVPFLIPVPPLEGTLPPQQLADEDSRFIEVQGLQVHYKQAGEGEPVLILLHGFAASTFSWREVLNPLAEYGTVIAFDRPAFGLTERPLKWSGKNPYSTSAQIDLTVGLMDQKGIEKAILVGNSAGGTIAVLTALQHPDRVKALILVDPAIYIGSGSPKWMRLFLNTPQARRIGPLFVRSIQNRGMDLAQLAWHDPSKITPEILAGYTLPLQVENWDRALWEFVAATDIPDIPKRLGEISIPVLVITGDDDRIVPTQQSIRLADELPNAQLVVIPNCGHLPQEECPQEFLDAVIGYLKSLQEISTNDLFTMGS